MTLPEDIYSQRILELAAALPRTARLEAPQATITTPVLNGTYSRPFTMTGAATDDRGVKLVQVAVKDRNKTTDQWWNPETGTWGPIKWTNATLTQTGAASTGWSWVFDDSANPPEGRADYFVQVRAKDTADKLSVVVNTRFSIG